MKLVRQCCPELLSMNEWGVNNVDPLFVQYSQALLEYQVATQNVDSNCPNGHWATVSYWIWNISGWPPHFQAVQHPVLNRKLAEYFDHMNKVYYWFTLHALQWLSYYRASLVLRSNLVFWMGWEASWIVCQTVTTVRQYSWGFCILDWGRDPCYHFIVQWYTITHLKRHTTTWREASPWLVAHDQGGGDQHSMHSHGELTQQSPSACHIFHCQPKQKTTKSLSTQEVGRG